MSSFFPFDGAENGKTLLHAETVLRNIVNPDDGDLLALDIAARAEDTLLNSLFRTLGPNETTAGVLAFNQLTPEQLETVGDASQREPGEEFAMVWAPEHQPKTERVRQFGAKTELTDEAIRRNDLTAASRAIDLLGLTILRKLDDYALAQLAVVEEAGLIVETEVPAIDPMVTSQSAPASATIGALVQAQAIGFESDLTVNYSVLVVRPSVKTQLILQAKALGLDLAEDFGLEVRSSRSINSDIGYLVDPARAGVVAFEDPVTSEVIDDRSRHVQIIQSWASPAVAVTTPSAVNRITFGGAA